MNNVSTVLKVNNITWIRFLVVLGMKAKEKEKKSFSAFFGLFIRE